MDATSSDKGPFDFDGRYGQGYEALAHRLIPGYDTLFEMTLALIDADVPLGGRVMVVGAGTGVELVAFGRLRPDLRLLGVDPSGPMLDLARRRVEQAGVGDRVSYHRGYAADVPSDALFDAATLFNVLHFAADDGGKADLLADVARRVKPGGAFALFDLHGDPESKEFDALMSAWRRYWTVRELPPDEAATFGRRIREGIHFASEARIVELARKAGFEEPLVFYRSLVYGGWLFRRR